MSKSPIGWIELRKELNGRFHNFRQFPLLQGYWALIVATMGTFGGWFPLVYPKLNSHIYVLTDQDWIGAWRNVATYVLALVSAACVDFLLPRSGTKTLRFFSIAMAVFAAGLALFGFLAVDLWLSILLVSSATVTAWVVWIIANADDERWIDEPDPRVATGGNTGMITGNLNGFKA